MNDFPPPPRPAFRMTASRGVWHEIAPHLSVMVLAVPRGRVPAYGLVFASAAAYPERIRFDWETLIEWDLAEPVNPPASVTPLSLASTPTPKSDEP